MSNETGAGLTLDRLIEVLCKYRRHLPGDTPIGYDFDGVSAALVQAVRAVGLMDDDDWCPGLAVVPLGKLSEYPQARVSLVLSDESLMEDPA